MSAKEINSRINEELPYLRRYARALSGSQSRGDDLAIHTLEAILDDLDLLLDQPDFKVSMFQKFHAIWVKSERNSHVDEDLLAQKAAVHLAHLAPNSREALLLSTIEKFSTAQIATIMQTEDATIEGLIKTAHDDMMRTIAGSVLVIEDEQLIAKDLSTLIEGLGHNIIGVARTFEDAIELSATKTPDLIVSDIQLATEATGIDAVHKLLDLYGNIPVVYITAFPEMLLTGKRKEPAFLITKPYKEDQVQSAISQAMFFRSTETLT